VEEMRNARNILFGKSKRKRQHEGLGRRLEDNIKMDLRGRGYEDVDEVQLVKDLVQ
jgi:hypothetical protein